MSKTFLPTILEQKEKEVAQLVMEDLQPLRQTYRLYEFLKSNQNKLQIISEVKKASPSMGDINLDVDIVAQAKTYEENGAAMISVLTDEVFFKGDISYLKEISSEVAIPTLAKDFIIDEKQIVRSRNAGATVILLIVAALPEARLKELYDFATSLGLEVLVETHNLPELEVAQAKTYEENGAAMISVLTDEAFFKGDISYLKEISSEVAIPTLAKDFIIDEKQIVRSRNAGATVILLIVAALPEARLKELYDFATSLGLEVLVETHNLPELEVAHRIGAEIIGVNNRNLVTFETDINTSLEMSAHFKDKPVYISESAIFTGQDAALVAPYFNGILVGTALMTADNVAEKVKELQIDKG